MRAMKRATVWVGATILVVTVSACAPQPHTDDTMLRGTHTMQGTPKPGAMSNEAIDRPPRGGPGVMLV